MDDDSLTTAVFTLVWVVGVFLVAIPAWVVSRTPDRLSARGGAARLVGLPLVALGAALYLRATRTLTAPGGTPVPTRGPEGLVTDGPYQYTRNPFFVSVLCVLAGEAALLGNVGLLAYTGVVWGYFEALVVGYEEPRLRERYGTAYEDYCESVPRWGLD